MTNDTYRVSLRQLDDEIQGDVNFSLLSIEVESIYPFAFSVCLTVCGSINSSKNNSNVLKRIYVT